MKFIALAAAALLACTPALAVNVTIDFEDVSSFASIDQFYNGGTDSDGRSGAALGVDFGLSLLGLKNDGLGGGVNGEYFSHAPTPVGVMFAADALDAVVNVAGGFSSFGFWYSSAERVAHGVEVWSGLDGTGDLLGSFDLAANATQGCTDSPFCHFDRLGAAFARSAHSVTFGNAVNVAAFDNLAIPEPTSALLAALALAGLVGARRRA